MFVSSPTVAFTLGYFKLILDINLQHISVAHIFISFLALKYFPLPQPKSNKVEFVSISNIYSFTHFHIEYRVLSKSSAIAS